MQATLRCIICTRLTWLTALTLKNHLVDPRSVKAVCLGNNIDFPSLPVDELEQQQLVDSFIVIYVDPCLHRLRMVRFISSLFVTIILVTASFVFKRRNQMPTTIQDLITRFETETVKTIVIFRSDNGGEFMSNDLIQWLTKRGIIHQTSTPKTPEQNGVAERYNRTILESMKSYMNVMKSC